MTHERQSFLAKRSASIVLSLALTTGLFTVGAVAATPASAASYTVGDGVQSLGIVATGANGGSATPWPPSRNIAGGTGAVVTTVLDSGFSVGDSIDTTVGTGGLGGPAGDNGAGGGLTLVHNTTSTEDLVIAGGGGGASRTDWQGLGTGGDAGVDPSGAGGDGTSREASSGGKGGANGVGGDAGVNENSECSNAVSGGPVNGGGTGYPYGISPGLAGATGSAGGTTGDQYWDCGGSGGAGYGGGGGGSAKRFSGGESGSQDFAGGGGAGGSYSISNSRTFEQHDENPGLGQTGLAGDALVTWIEQSDLTLGSSGPAGSVELDWTTPGFSEDSERLGTISYKIYRDGTEIHTTSGSSFVDYPGSGVHVYQIESVAPLNNKAGTKVGDLETLSESQNSEEVPVVAPSITAVSPRTGPATGGTVITIEGTNLIGSSVTIGGVPCTSVVVNQTGTSLTCLTPAGSAGGKLIKVTNDGGSTNAGNFTYQGGGGKVLKPLKPTKVAVTGGSKSTKRVVRWKAPVNKAGNRPVAYYRLKLNRVRCSNFIVNKKLNKKATSYTFKRSLLLKNMGCRTTRGEAKPNRAVFQVTVEAFNSAGGGPVSARRFLVRR